jgi:IS30 family transposase
MTTEEKRRIDILKRDRKSISEIAKELKISPNTIKSYLQRRKSENSCLIVVCTLSRNRGENKRSSALINVGVFTGANNISIQTV